MIIGFDIETYGEKNLFLCGSVVTPEKVIFSRDKQELIQFLKEYGGKDHRTFATNLGFDIFSLFTDEELPPITPTIRGSRVIGAQYLQNKPIRFADSMNFFPMSVERLGKEIVGMQKLPKPEFLGEIPQSEKEWEILKEYNIQDALITQRSMAFLERELQSLGADMKMTIASTALDLWNKRFNDRILEPMPLELLEKIFQGYYGGRTEAFYRGSIPPDFRLYDINSLYPYVMAKYPFPFPNSHKYQKHGKYDDIHAYEGMSRVRVSLTKNILPYLPHRAEDGKLLFPLGSFEGWYTHFELRRAEELGYTIEKVYETISFIQTWKPFEKFINFLYQKRKEHKDTPLDHIYKILMNSLYGRFGLKLHGERIIRHIDSLKMTEISFLERNGYKEHIAGANNEWRYYERVRLTQEDISPMIQPILSAYVTAYGRDELYRWNIEAATQKKKVLYNDTDSVFTDAIFPTSDLLGDMKCEAILEEGLIIKPKCYYYRALTADGLKTKIKIKGIRTKEEEKEQRILELRGLSEDKEKNALSFDKFSTFLMSNRKYQGRFPAYNEKLKMIRKLAREDTKRIWPRTFQVDVLQSSKPKKI